MKRKKKKRAVCSGRYRNCSSLSPVLGKRRSNDLKKERGGEGAMSVFSGEQTELLYDEGGGKKGTGGEVFNCVRDGGTTLMMDREKRNHDRTLEGRLRIYWKGVKRCSVTTGKRKDSRNQKRKGGSTKPSRNLGKEDSPRRGRSPWSFEKPEGESVTMKLSSERRGGIMSKNLLGKLFRNQFIVGGGKR